MNTFGGIKKIRLTSNAFLGLIGVFVVAFSILLLVLLSKKPSELSADSELKSISRNIRQHFQRDADYRGLNTAYALENNIVPKPLIRANKIFSALGAEILIGADLSGRPIAPFENTFGIIYKNLNAKKCETLISSEFDAASGLVAITVSNEKSSEFSYGGNPALPVSKKAAEETCSAKNTVMFTFE
ncbi:MAG: hypothetical protein IJ870_04330 [Alphaproteobacteria bacterium]|nr:hypothetical protein [Alphaproteobacteria bacterium]